MNASERNHSMSRRSRLDSFRGQPASSPKIEHFRPFAAIVTFGESRPQTRVGSIRRPILAQTQDPGPRPPPAHWFLSEHPAKGPPRDSTRHPLRNNGISDPAVFLVSRGLPGGFSETVRDVPPRRSTGICVETRPAQGNASASDIPPSWELTPLRQTNSSPRNLDAHIAGWPRALPRISRAHQLVNWNSPRKANGPGSETNCWQAQSFQDAPGPRPLDRLEKRIS